MGKGSTVTRLERDGTVTRLGNGTIVTRLEKVGTVTRLGKGSIGIGSKG